MAGGHGRPRVVAPEVAGEANPVLAAVANLLGDHAEDLLESHWTVEKTGDGSLSADGSTSVIRRKRVAARLDNVLDLQSLTMMMDLLLSTGLVLHHTRALPGGHERVQIVLQARRDPSNQGYVYLESIEGNNVRYTVRLDIKNKSWSKIQSGAMGTTAVQTGEPVIHNPTAGPTEAAGGEAGVRRAPVLGCPPEGAVMQATERGGYQQTMGAQRDTFFVPGRSDRYGGDLELTISLTKTWQPSTLLNTALLNVPHYVSAWWQDTADQRREGHTAVVLLKERVLIPHAAIHHEILPELPPSGIAAIEEEAVTPGQAPGALPITAADLLDRRVLSLGYDHEKLQVLFGEVMAKLAGNELPDSGQRSHAVARLTERGTRTQDALRYLLSHPVFTRYLDRQLDRRHDHAGAGPAGRYRGPTPTVSSACRSSWRQGRTYSGTSTGGWRPSSTSSTSRSSTCPAPAAGRPAPPAGPKFGPLPPASSSTSRSAAASSGGVVRSSRRCRRWTR